MIGFKMQTNQLSIIIDDWHNTTNNYITHCHGMPKVTHGTERVKLSRVIKLSFHNATPWGSGRRLMSKSVRAAQITNCYIVHGLLHTSFLLNTLIL